MGLEQDYQKPRWTVLDALLVFVIIICTKWVLPFPRLAWFNNLSRVTSPSNLYLGQVFWSSLLMAGCFFLLIGLIIKLKYRQSWSALGLKSGKGKNWLLIGLVQGVLLFLIMTILVTIISLFYSFEVEEQVVVDVFNTATNHREQFLCFIIAAVVAPFSEELYFRGFLYPAFGKLMGRLPAVIFTSLFFSCLHFDLIRFIPIAIGGIWLNLLYIRTGSLYTSMLAHSVWNTIMITLLFYAQSVGA